MTRAAACLAALAAAACAALPAAAKLPPRPACKPSQVAKIETARKRVWKTVIRHGVKVRVQVTVTVRVWRCRPRPKPGGGAGAGTGGSGAGTGTGTGGTAGTGGTGGAGGSGQGPVTPVLGSTTGVTLREFTLNASRLELAAGDVHVSVTNFGEDPHDLALEGPGGQTIPVAGEIAPSSTASATVHLAAGQWTFYCTLPGHRALGMSRQIDVR